MTRMEWRVLAALSLALAAASVGVGVAIGSAAALAVAGVAIGVVGGAGVAEALLDRHVGRLRGMSRRMVDGDLATVALPGPLGRLDPVATDLAQVAAAFSEAQTAATHDRLTHIPNRSTLLAQLFGEVDRATRYSRPLTIAFIDIDHFKAVNDTHGHAAGDAVLRAIADVLRGNVRDTDLLGRYGGEEFVLILPETGIDEATAVAEKLRLQVLKERVEVGEGEEVAVSVSIGLAGGHGRALQVEQLVRDADAAMYSAKSLGRNQTYVFAEVDDDTARIPRSPISAAGRARAAEVGEIGRQAAEAALAAIVAPLPHYRGKPSSLIAAIAVRIARQLELPESEVERVRVASLLHDIGKVGVPQEILEKPGTLSPDEWQAVVQHPQIGQVIINQVAAVKDAGAIILHHHERYSGHGYPHGLRGGDIPLGARIVAIADAYDAMVQDRPYRRAISHEEAVAELRRHAGLQFDPTLVDVFCSLFASERPEADDSLLMSPPRPIGSGTRRRRGSAAAG